MTTNRQLTPFSGGRVCPICPIEDDPHKSRIFLDALFFAALSLLQISIACTSKFTLSTRSGIAQKDTMSDLNFHQVHLIIACCICLTVSCIFVLLRGYVRRTTAAGFWWDDWACFVALVGHLVS